MDRLVKSKKMAGGGFEGCPFIEKCDVFKEFKKLESSVHSLCPLPAGTPGMIVLQFCWFILRREERHIARIRLADFLAGGRKFPISPNRPNQNFPACQRCNKHKPSVRRDRTASRPSAIKRNSLDPLHVTRFLLDFEDRNRMGFSGLAWLRLTASFKCCS